MKTVLAIGRIENGEFVDVVLADQAALDAGLILETAEMLDRFHDEGRDPYEEDE